MVKPKGALVLWKFKFCAKNHLVKVGTLNWCIKHTVYIHKGTVQRHLWLIEGVYLPLRGKQGVFSLKKFAYVSLYMAKRDIKALWVGTSRQIAIDTLDLSFIGIFFKILLRWNDNRTTLILKVKSIVVRTQLQL